MSVIIDALRKGRGRQVPRSRTNVAQTDAVLVTLGYGGSGPNARVNRTRRILGCLAAAIILAIVIWRAVM